MTDDLNAAPKEPSQDPSQEPRQDPQPPLNRSISPIAAGQGASGAGKMVVLAALIAGCGVFLTATWRGDKARPASAPQAPAKQVVAYEPMRPPAPAPGAPTPAAPTLADPGPGAPSLGQAFGPYAVPALQSGAPETIPGAGPQPALQAGSTAGSTAGAGAQGGELWAIRAAPILAYSRGGGGEAGLEVQPGRPAPSASSQDPTELEQLRRGSAIGQVRATRLGDRNFLILAGGTIPCILQTAMDTATPGYVSCLIARDVFSDNGAVVLMEKGSKVLGEYRSSLRQGQRRLFVLWTRAVTPAGVAVDLASPATDPLGRAGFDGEVDNHFWSRFGGALLLSIVDDAAFAIGGADDRSGALRLPSDAAGVALQNSVNIAPSLRKAQGAQVSIFVARDLDFSSVYRLKAK